MPLPSRRELLPFFGLGGAIAFANMIARRAWAQSDSSSLAVIVHPSCPIGTQGQADLASYFLGARRIWDTGERISMFNLPNGNPVRVIFDRVVLKMEPTEIARHWLDRRIRGEGSPPRQVPTADLLVRLVRTLPGSIGYAPESLIDSGVRVVARIRAGQVVKP